MSNWWDKAPVAQPAPKASGDWWEAAPVADAPKLGAAVEPAAPFANVVSTVTSNPLPVPERTAGQVVDDTGLMIRRGTRNVVGGLAGAPVNVVNTVLQRGPVGQVQDLAEWLGLGRLIDPISQPELVTGLREGLAMQTAEDVAEYQSPLLAAQERGFQEAEGFLPSLGYLVDNPSYLAMVGAEQIPQLATAVPGKVLGTIGLQGVSAGSQNEAQVAELLAEQVAAGEITQADADAIASDVFAASTGLNTALPFLPGASVLERIAANRLSQTAGQSVVGAGLRGLVGEGAQGVLSEGGDQVISNLGTGAPITEGVGQAAALGLLTEGPLGGIGGGIEAATAPRAAPPPAGLPPLSDIVAPATPPVAPAATEPPAPATPVAETAKDSTGGRAAPNTIEALLADPELAALLDALPGAVAATPSEAQAPAPPVGQGGSPVPVGGDSPRIAWNEEVEGVSNLRTADGTLMGQLLTEDTPDAIQIQGIEISPEFRGQGVGVSVYQQLADRALAEGKVLRSDPTEISEDAQRIYPALERRGYTVERGKTQAGVPTFTVTAGPGAAPAPAAAPAAPVARPAPIGEAVAPPARFEPEPEPERQSDRSLSFLRREVGWEQMGGRMIRGGEVETREDTGASFGRTTGDVVGRTPWVPRTDPGGRPSTFWRNRPGKLTEKEANIAFDRYEAGEVLTKRQQAFIDYARETARQYAEDEAAEMARLREFDKDEQMAALAALREDVDIAPEQEGEALALYDLIAQAMDNGADEIDVTPSSGETDREYAARLWTFIRGPRNVEPRATQEDRSEGGQDIADAEPAPAPARGQAGLFGAPTARETVEAARRDRDAQRDGRTGTGRTDMAAGAGELFAGPRPAQADLEQVPSSLDSLGRPQPPPPVEVDTGRTRYRAKFSYVWSIRPSADFLESTPLDALTYSVEKAEEISSGQFSATNWTRIPADKAPKALIREAERIANQRAPDSSEPAQPGLLESRNTRQTDGQRAEAREAARRLDTEDAPAPGADADVDPMVDDIRRGIRNLRAIVSPEAAAIREKMGIPSRNVTVVDGPADLDPELRERLNPSPMAEGLFDPVTGRVFVFRIDPRDGQPITPKRAVWVAFHEVAGHLGIRGAAKKLAGNDRGRWLENLMGALESASRNPFIERVAAEIRRQQPDYDVAISIEEALAEMAAAIRTGNYAEIEGRYKVRVPLAQRNTLAGDVARLVDALRAFLRRFTGDTTFTDAEVYRLLDDAWRYAETAPVGEAGLRGTEAPESRRPATDQTQTPEFKRWFGDSKVVDADGKPLVVYHGTDADFSEFDTSGLGAHFTTSASVASRFGAGNAGKVVPVFLSLKSPLRIEEKGGHHGNAATVAEELIAAGALPQDYLNEAFYERLMENGALGNTSVYEANNKAEIERMRAELSRQGYDGIVYRNVAEGGGDSYIAFTPTQIKSATGNRGTFDPLSPSILESRRPEAPEFKVTATTTAQTVIAQGRALSLVDEATKAGLDLGPLKDAYARKDGPAVVAAMDALIAQLQPEPKRTTGLKNAVTDAERAAANRDPILRDAIQTNEDTVVQAMRELRDDPMAGDEAIARISRGGEMSLADEGILLVYKTQLMNERNAAADVLADPSASESRKEAAREASARTEAKIAALDVAASAIGTEGGRMLQFRRRMMQEDFTLAALESKERARLERPLTREELAKIKEMADTIATLQARVEKLNERIQNAESESAYANVVDLMAGKGPKKRPTLDALRKAADEARARLKATPEVARRGGQSGAIISPAVFYDYAVIGAFHIADGAAKFADWVRAMSADLGERFDQFKDEHPRIFRASKAAADKPLKAEATVAEVMAKVDTANITPKDVRKLVEAHVGEGLRGEPAVVAAVAKDLGIDEAQVRRLFVQTSPRPQTVDEAKQEVRDLRKIIRLEAEIERLEAGQPKPARGAPMVDSPAVAAKKAELAAVREALRAAARPDPEARYQELRGQQIQKRIADIEARIAAGDFAPRPRIPRALSEANDKAMFELQKAKEAFAKAQFEDEIRRRGPLAKVFGGIGDVFNLARAVMTSFDLSAPLRQGGFIVLGNPMRGLTGFVPMLRSFASAEADFKAKSEIENRPNAPLYKKYGLELTGIGTGPLAQIEEAYASRWLDKLPSAIGGGLVRGSGRAYTSFLNRLRADSFDAMVASLTKTGAPTEAEGKAIANYINVATGRGPIGGREKAGEVLNTVFFAPRLVASRFQLLAGQPLYGGSARTRRMIAKEYARYLMGAGVVLGLAAFALGDDEDEKPIVSMDPRSVDFGKVRIGNTFVDPLSGLAQVTVFLARLATGETVSGKGEAKPVRQWGTLTDLRRAMGQDIPAHDLNPDGTLGFGATSAADLIGRFLRTKLAPAPGAIVNSLSGENLIGEQVTPLDAAQELVTPMSFGDIADAMEEHGVPKGAALGLLVIFGMGVQTRDEASPLTATDTARTDIKERLSVLPVDQWQAEMEAMREEYGPVMDGVSLAIYKKDGKYGKAGEPRRTAEGMPVLETERLSNQAASRRNYQASLEAKGMTEDQIRAEMARTSVHHVIPDNVVRQHPLMIRARTELDYDLDQPSNLVGLAKEKTEATESGDELGHWTDHPFYDMEVVGQLDAAARKLRRKHGSVESAPKQEVLDAIRAVEDAMRKRIEAQDVPKKGGRLAALDTRRTERTA